MHALKEEQGNITSAMDKIVKVAEEFYRDLQSIPGNQDDNGRIISLEVLEIPPVKPEEVKKALDAMQRDKAAGAIQITADLWKDGGQIVLEKLAILYTQCPMTSNMPESWKNAKFILILKIRDAKDLRNYRPIGLLSVAYNVFRKVIANRSGTCLDFNEPNDQAGFSTGYATIDNIHTINQVIEKCAEYNRPLYIAFIRIDYEKAFGSVANPAVKQALRNQGVDASYVKMLQDIYSGSRAPIVLHKESKKIPIKKGVR